MRGAHEVPKQPHTLFASPREGRAGRAGPGGEGGSAAAVDSATTGVVRRDDPPPDDDAVAVFGSLDASGPESVSVAELFGALPRFRT